MISNILKIIFGTILMIFVYILFNLYFKEGGKLPVPKTEPQIHMDKLFELGSDKELPKLIQDVQLTKQAKALYSSLDSSKNIKEESKQTYLELYQNLKLAQQCELASQSFRYNLLRINTDDIDPKEVIKNKIKSPSPLQVQLWTELFLDCELLAINFNNINEADRELTKMDSYYDNYSIEQEIYNQLLTKPAKTEQEISLKFALIDSKIYLELGERVSINRELKYSLPEQQVVSIKEEISRLQELSIQLVQTVDDYIETGKYEKMLNEIKNRKELLKQASEPDEESYNELVAKFTNLHNRFIKRLHSKSAYEFNLALFTLLSSEKNKIIHNNRYSIEKFNLRQIDQEIFKNSRINDYNYFQITIHPTINIFQCIKGVDCSTTSELAINYCLGIGRKKEDPDACDVDLVSFYFQSYLSENQLNDIQKTLNYLERHYD